MTNSLPSFVQAYSLEAAKQAAATNFTAAVHGGPKVGKSHFVFRAERPLFVVYLDTNPNVHTHLIKSSAELKDPKNLDLGTFGDEIYQLIISPRPYKELTVADAEKILDQIEEFRDWAVQTAYERKAEGRPGGTFVVDGMLYFKGYCEKAILGESVTLGWRPKRGESTEISTYDYAKSNAAVFEFVSSFVNKPIDAAFTWEGREIYKDVIDSRGKVQNKKTDAWRSTRPTRMPFMLSAEVEALKVLERANPADNKSPLITLPKLRIITNAEGLNLDQMVIPATTFYGLKRLLLEPTIGDLEVARLAVPASAVLRANDAGFALAEAVSEAGADDE